jgi:glucokinase
VGFGVPGILDLRCGVVQRSPNLPKWQQVDLRTLLDKRLDVPFAIENDANVAVLGETWLGAGRSVEHCVMLTLGTGVGGGVLIDGEILHGARGYAGELGHTVVDPNGPACGCGSQGCLEQFASGTAIARMAKPHYGTVSAADVAQKARRGATQALEIYARVGYALGVACASFANLLNPQRIILGGGVAGAFDLFGETLHHTMRQRSFREVYDNLRLVQAQCGTDAGGLGAACLAKSIHKTLTHRCRGSTL